MPRLLLLAEQNCRRVDQPENFERFNQSFGYAVYSTQLPDNAKYLKINFLRDLAYVFVDGEYQVGKRLDHRAHLDVCRVCWVIAQSTCAEKRSSNLLIERVVD